MKLIIDIPEEVYKGLADDTHIFVKPILSAIKNGTPIPDNATVCDIEQIRAEIEQERFNHIESRYDKGYDDAITDTLAIIDKYTKGERE